MRATLLLEENEMQFGSNLNGSFGFVHDETRNCLSIESQQIGILSQTFAVIFTLEFLILDVLEFCVYEFKLRFRVFDMFLTSAFYV